MRSIRPTIGRAALGSHLDHARVSRFVLLSRVPERVRDRGLVLEIYSLERWEARALLVMPASAPAMQSRRRRAGTKLKRRIGSPFRSVPAGSRTPGPARVMAKGGPLATFDPVFS